MDVSDTFYFFSARGGGRGSPKRGEGGGIGFLLKIPGEGGGRLFARRGRGQEGACGEFWTFWRGGGGLNIFFGAETSTTIVSKLSANCLLIVC